MCSTPDWRTIAGAARGPASAGRSTGIRGAPPDNRLGHPLGLWVPPAWIAAWREAESARRAGPAPSSFPQLADHLRRGPLLPALEALKHSSMMRAGPVQASADRAVARLIGRHVRRQSLTMVVSRDLQWCVIHQAASEGLSEPVDVQGSGKTCSEFVQASAGEEQGDTRSRLMVQDASVSREEVTAFASRLAQQLGVARSPLCRKGVIACGAKIARQASEHLVTEESGRSRHGEGKPANPETLSPRLFGTAILSGLYRHCIASAPIPG